MTEAAVDRARSCLGGDVDWRYLLAAAREHAVLPLVARNVRLHLAGSVSQEAHELMTNASCRCMQRNLALTAELVRIWSLLRKAGVEIIPFKGPTLALLAYGDLSLRMFADLDILVKEADVDRAVEALFADGYTLEYEFTPRQGRGYRAAECALQLRHAGRDSTVELHWLLTERYLSVDLRIDELWQRSGHIQVGRLTMKSLAPEDLFLYLCVHGSKHRWERLEWLCSVAALAQSNPNIRWDEIERRARDCGAERMLRLALLLARNLLSMPLPPALREAVENDSAVARLAAEAANSLLHSDPAPAPIKTNRGEWYLYLLRVRERWRDKLRILAYSSLRRPHPTSRELILLPPSVDFLYYVLRPARLLSVTLWAALRRAAGGETASASPPRN